jgi:protein-S-isoprenylcysteine O-methyltransferase Ste14
VDLRELVGSGDRIGLVMAPIVVIGLLANVAMPDAFAVGGPPDALRAASLVVLVVGLAAWLWSVVLILRNVPRHTLITSGPFALVRHPLYTSVAVLVLPWLGILLDTWLGLAIGIALYGAARLFEGREESELAVRFGPAWEHYRDGVLIPWL